MRPRIVWAFFASIGLLVATSCGRVGYEGTNARSEVGALDAGTSGATGTSATGITFDTLDAAVGSYVVGPDGGVFQVVDGGIVQVVDDASTGGATGTGPQCGAKRCSSSQVCCMPCNVCLSKNLCAQLLCPPPLL